MHPLRHILTFYLLFFAAFGIAESTEKFHAAMKLDTKEQDMSSCIYCHANNGFFDEADSPKTSERSAMNDGIAISQACDGCHNGIQAKNMQMKNSFCIASGEKGCSIGSHPVFVPYDGSKKGYRRTEAPLEGRWYKASRVKDLLHSGKVACASCHDPHNSATRTFVRNTTHLCQGCHIK